MIKNVKSIRLGVINIQGKFLLYSVFSFFSKIFFSNPYLLFHDVELEPVIANVIFFCDTLVFRTLEHV